MRGRLLLLGVVLGPGCDEDVVVSEGERFAVELAGVHTREQVRWTPPYRVLVGTRLCPRVRCDACEAAGTCEGVTLVARGPLRPDGAGCDVAEAPGTVEWRAGAPCDDADAPVDRAVLEVVDPAAVEAAPRLWPDEVAEVAGARTAGAGLAAAPGSPLRVVAEARVRLPVRLTTAGHVVGWSDGAVTLTPAEGRAPVAYPGGALELVAFADTVAAASFAAGGRTWPLGQVVGVAAGAAAEIELGAAYAAAELGGHPTLARAWVRDADGEPLLGLPVTWTLRAGEVALAADAALPGQDYVRIADTCLPPERRGGPRRATIAAAHGGVSARLELAWDGVAGAPDPAFVPDDRCPGGCGCRGGGGTAGLVLPWLRRRRRRGA